MLVRKTVKSKFIIFISILILTISQTLSVFADIVMPGMENIGEETAEEATMWLPDEMKKSWKTETSSDGENSVIYTSEKLHSGCKAYHTIGYILFLGKEGNKSRTLNNIDTSIKPLFYSPEEGRDTDFDIYNVEKYINLKKVGEKFKKENSGINPYTRRLFLTPIVTYRNYESKNSLNHADIIRQNNPSSDEIYTFDQLVSKINDLYTYDSAKFEQVCSSGKGFTSKTLAGKPVSFFAPLSNIVNELKGKNIGIKTDAFGEYKECLINIPMTSKAFQSFAPANPAPIIKIDDIQYDEPNTSNVPIITSTEYPGTHADITGMPIPDSAIAINGEYYFGNKPEQADYDWSEKGGGYIPVTENITASVKADNWIGQSQFAQCHDTAIFRVYFKIKYTKPRRAGHHPHRYWVYPTKTYNMYVDVPRDVYYWKLYSFSGYKLTNITLTNGAYPDKTITFDFDPPMSEDHTYYNGATSKYITNNVDWTDIGCTSVITIDVTGKSNRLNEGIAKARATATNYVGYPTAWNDAFSITTDTKTLTYLTDDKVKMSRSKNRTATPKHYTEWDQDYISDKDTITIPPTVANGYYGTTIQRTYTKFAEFNAKEMDAMTFYAEKDIKSSNASPSISSGSYAKTRQSVNYEHILRDDPK